MSTPPPIREWALANRLPGVGARGPIAHEARVAYAEAHDLPTPDRPERGAPARSRSRGQQPRKRRRVPAASCSCGRNWDGLVECHCRRCHRHFRSVKGFDLHLVPRGLHSEEPADCVDPLQIRYRSGQHKGEPKMRLVDAHYGMIYATGEERPDTLEFPT